jgi:hypothetical protein
MDFVTPAIFYSAGLVGVSGHTTDEGEPRLSVSTARGINHKLVVTQLALQQNYSANESQALVLVADGNLKPG